MTDKYAEIRAALDAGPTPGPWAWDDDSRIATVTTVAEYRIGPDYKTSSQARYDFHAACEIDAAYIAAANPEVIRALLAERDSLGEFASAFLLWAATGANPDRLEGLNNIARAALAQEQGGSDDA